LWIGTYGGGLNKFDTVSGTFTHYRNTVGDHHSLSHDVITDIFFDRAGEMWVATFGGGLNRYDAGQDNFVHYHEKDGLASNIVAGLLEDDQKRLWVSTSKGISKFDRVTQRFRNYDFRDGLQNGEFNPGAKLYYHDGSFFFGGTHGVNLFYPKNVRDNPHKPEIALTSFKIFEKPAQLDGDVSHLNSLLLDYKDKFFSFEFAALEFTMPEANQYAYKLENFDDSWLYSGNRNYASYTNIDPGDYVLRVVGSNNDGLWNESGVSVNIRIRPPFWLTWWFRIVFVTACGMILFYSYHRRVSSLKKDKLAQEAYSRQLIEIQEQERKRIASELHDSIGQDLLIITNGIQHSLGMLPDDSKVTDELNQLSEVALSSIDEVREISSNLHPHQLDRLGLKMAIKAMVDKIANASGLKISVDVDPVDDLFDKNQDINVYRIIQEALNNIVKHARAKNVQISVTKLAKMVMLRIKDDGIGFDTNARINRASGFGLTSMAERTKILHGTIEFISTAGDGAEIRIEIPVDESPATD
jgi:signal transduction histidine kinase